VLAAAQLDTMQVLAMVAPLVLDHIAVQLVGLEQIKITTILVVLAVPGPGAMSIYKAVADKDM
jgi:hypothetical protein